MRLRTLELDNFRQFYGPNSLAFAQADDLNVTVIYGANGSGKTAILNAFTWTLYNEFTPDFENPERIINDRAWDETPEGGDVEVRSVVEFEHEQSIYRIARATTQRKGHQGSRVTVRDSVVTAIQVDPDGRQTERGNPGELASQILPKRLFNFFFFNGERIEKLVDRSAYAQIEDGIKTLLGLSIVERAVAHSDAAIRDLRKAQQKVGSAETQGLIDELRNAETRRDEKLEEQRVMEREREQLDVRLSAIDKKLRSLEAAKQIQQQRDDCEADLQSAKRSIEETRAQVAEDIGAGGYLAFSEGLARRSLDTIRALHEAGDLPAKLKKQFVDERLELHMCICGRELVEGEAPYGAVAAWREHAGAGAEEAWGQLSAYAKHMLEERPKFYAGVKSQMQRLVELGSREKQLQEKLSDLHQQLDSKDSEEIKDLEHRRNDVKEELGGLERKLGGIGIEIVSLEKQMRVTEKQLSEAIEKSEEAELAKRRVDVATQARNIFEQILALRTEEVRSNLDERIRRIYSGISFKTAVPRLSSEFHLELLQSLDGGLVPAKSTGENLVLSLSFVGALAEYARLRYEETAQRESAGSGIQFRGGIYPLVADSPFTNLDDNYCTDVARVIPVLAPQVVVMLSKRQGLGPAESELGARIGARHILVYYTPKEGEADEKIELVGHQYPYIVHTEESWERASIESLGSLRAQPRQEDADAV